MVFCNFITHRNWTTSGRMMGEKLIHTSPYTCE